MENVDDALHEYAPPGKIGKNDQKFLINICSDAADHRPATFPGTRFKTAQKCMMHRCMTCFFMQR